MIPFKDVIAKLNEYPGLDKNTQFHLDMVWTPFTIGNNQVSEFISYANSIIKDHAIIPPETDLMVRIISNDDCYEIVKWINRRIFTPQIEALQNNKLCDIRMTDVRLRIAGNLAIHSAYTLTKSERIEWNEWFKKVYRARMIAIADYYCTEIEKLPF